MVSSPSSGRSSWASSSISAGVASRPAQIPKLTRTSRPGASGLATENATLGSAYIFLAFPSCSALTLLWLPAEAAHGDDQAGQPPRGDHGDVGPVGPDLLVSEEHVLHQPDEVGERQQLGDDLEDTRIRVRRPERAGEKGHREIDGVHDGGRAFGRADQC